MRPRDAAWFAFWLALPFVLGIIACVAVAVFITVRMSL